MDPHALKLFLHLSHSLHFGRTSQECHVSPPTLSRAIQRIEETLGKKLFERNRRSTTLTPAGRLFQSYAQETLQNWENLNTRLQQSSETLQGELSIYCSVTASYSILPGLLNTFRDQYPEIHIKLLTGDPAMAIDKILDRSADIAVAALPEKVPTKIETHLVTSTPLLFIGPTLPGPVTTLLDAPRVKWSDIPMVFPESGLIRTHLEQWFHRKNLRPRIYGTVSGHEAILSLVGLGLGAGVIPQLVLEKSMIQTNVRTLDVKPSLPDFQVAVCALRNRLSSPIVAAFWNCLA